MYGLKPVPFSAFPLPWAAHKTMLGAIIGPPKNLHSVLVK
jgi:hypothetical protein